MKLVRNPLLQAIGLALLGACAGFIASSRMDADWKLHDDLQQAAVALLFVALLGGAVKLLLDDYARGRERRAEQARFAMAVLADLKSVYDRVERVRILVPAHRSALTYGNVMRDLIIDARVQLRNVARALDAQTSGMSPSTSGTVVLAVDAMGDYLGGLIGEFQRRYKPIADEQKLYEARVKKALEPAEGEPGMPAAENAAWPEIAALPEMVGFIGDWSDPDRPPPAVPPEPYEQRFGEPLDLASWLLRSELRHPAAVHGLPSELDGVRVRLEAAAAQSDMHA